MLDDWLDAHQDELIAFRRRLHAHPEVSGEEYQTTESVVERLEVAGLSPRVLDSGTGLVCDIGTDGPLVALRADIDALAMPDEKDVHYRSQNPGVAHACGHDVHTTAVLGAGLFLANHSEFLPGRVRLIFQPAEEAVPGGAVGVIEEGWLDGVDSIYGVHCDPKLDVGKVGLRSGALTSATDSATIMLRGPGGHTARPEETVDMVSTAAGIVMRLPDDVRRLIGESGHIKIVFGALHAGDAANVIPTTATLRASIRTPSMEAWHELPAAFAKALSMLLEGTDAEFELDYTTGIPPVVNHESTTAMVRRTAFDALGADAVTEAVQSWGGDDFSWYLRKVPGTYIRVGTHDPDSGERRRDLHVGDFDVDERSIGVAVRTLVAIAEHRLAEVS